VVASRLGVAERNEKQIPPLQGSVRDDTRIEW
jgi:hypothetical protein